MLVDRWKTRPLFIYYTRLESNRRDYWEHMLGIEAHWGLREEWATPQLLAPLWFLRQRLEDDPRKLLHYADSRVDLYCALLKKGSSK